MPVRAMIPLSDYRFGGSPTLALLGLALLIAIFVVIAYTTKNGPLEPPKCDPWRTLSRKAKRGGGKDGS